MEIRGRNRIPFHSALMQGKRTPFEEEDVMSRSKKRPRPAFHSGIMMGKRYPLFESEDAVVDKRKASRLRWSDGMLFGK